MIIALGMLGMDGIVGVCLLLASAAYEVPKEVLEVIAYDLEGGTVGAANSNTDGSVDFGVMQVNSIWLNDAMIYFDVGEDAAKDTLKNSVCGNVFFASHILSGHLKRNNGDVVESVGDYHSRTPSVRRVYINKFVEMYSRRFLEGSDVE